MANTTSSLFPPDHETGSTRLLMAAAVAPIRSFALDDFAPYRQLRILTYSATPTILRTLFRRFPDQRIECVIGSPQVIGNLADAFAHQAAVAQAARTAMTELGDDERDALRARIDSGQLQLRVVRGHVSHAKLYLASDSATAQDLAIVGSANLSATALLGRQDELMVGFHDQQAWDDLEAEYERIRATASDDMDLARLIEAPSQTPPSDPGGIPLLDPDHPATDVVLAPPDETRTAADADEDRNRIETIVLKAFRRQPEVLKDSPAGRLDSSQRGRYSDLLRYTKPGEQPDHPTFNLRLDDGKATFNGQPWALTADPDGVATDAEHLQRFWNSYRKTFRGDIDQLQANYFSFLCWLFLTPVVCTLRHQARQRGHDLIQYPKVGILYGKANAGKTQLVETALRFMFGNDAPGAHRAPERCSVRSKKVTAGCPHSSTTSHRNACGPTRSNTSRTSRPPGAKPRAWCSR